MEEVKELAEYINSIQIIFGSFFAAILFLLTYIWKMTQAANEKRHKQHEDQDEIHEKMFMNINENLSEQKLINQKMELLMELYGKDIQELKTT